MCTCHCKKPQWRTWKITLLSAHQRRVCLVLQRLTSITHQGKTPEHCLSYAGGQQFRFPHFNLTTQVLQGLQNLAHTVSISPKKKKADKPCDEWKHAYIQSSGSFKDYEPRMKKLFQGTLHMTVVFTETLISLKQDYDRPFYWSVIWSVCTQCWTTCWHVSLSFLRSSWRFDRWAALLWSLSASQGAQRDGKITPYKAN